MKHLIKLVKSNRETSICIGGFCLTFIVFFVLQHLCAFHIIDIPLFVPYGYIGVLVSIPLFLGGNMALLARRWNLGKKG